MQNEQREKNQCYMREVFRRRLFMSLLIKDTTREEREQIIRQSLDCGGGDVKTVLPAGLAEGILLICIRII